jgi:hypothetical protein
MPRHCASTPLQEPVKPVLVRIRTPTKPARMDAPKALAKAIHALLKAAPNHLPLHAPIARHSGITMHPETAKLVLALTHTLIKPALAVAAKGPVS